MKANNTKLGIGRLCVLFGKTRHAFYDKNWYLEEKYEAEYIVLELVAQIRRELPKIGTPKLYHMIKQPLLDHNIKMGRDALHTLLQSQGLTVKMKKRYVKTTNSNHWMKKYPNIIKELVLTESEQVWVSDITYILVSGDFNYLSLITDAYSKLIVGYCLRPTLEATGSLNALEMAILTRKKSTILIHHSDRGVQYCCNNYVEMLKINNIEISMTENGDPYENAIAERVNGILKNEFNLNKSLENREIALEQIKKSIELYNEKRPHLSNNFLTPFEAHKQTGILEKKWKPKIYNKREVRF